MDAVVRAIVAAVRTGDLTEERLAEAAARRLPAARDEGGDEPPRDVAIGSDVARRAIAVEGRAVGALRGAVVVTCRPPTGMAVGEVPWGVAAPLRALDPSVVAHDLTDPGSGLGEILDQVGERPLVVVVRDAPRHPWQLAVLDTVVGARPDAIAVEMGWSSPAPPSGPCAGDVDHDQRRLAGQRRGGGAAPVRGSRMTDASGARPELTIGVDIGGTKTLALAVDPQGRPMASARLGTETASAQTVVAGAETAVRLVAEELGLDPADTGVVGVGVPGRVNPRLGTVVHAVNLGLAEEPLLLGPLLEDALGLPVHVENDVNAAALGAGLLLGRPDADLAYLSIGTGIAAGFVLGGRIRRGRRGLAGEIGHLTVDPHGERCECGRRGCLELVASGSALARMWPVDLGRSPAEELFRAAATGHGGAVAVRDRLAGHLADAVLLLVLTTDVELVVLGGGVAEVGEPLLAAVQAAVRERAGGAVFLDGEDLAGSVVLAPHAPVGAIGAALAARRHRADELSLDVAWAAAGAP